MNTRGQELAERQARFGAVTSAGPSPRTLLPSTRWRRSTH